MYIITDHITLERQKIVDSSYTDISIFSVHIQYNLYYILIISRVDNNNIIIMCKRRKNKTYIMRL